jgi:prepilin-type processing-associated H-X9-DG protein
VNPFLADIAAIDPATSFAGPLPVNGAVRMVEITDGTANTILITEAGRRLGMAWCSPDVTVGLRDALGGPHRGSNVAMADGSVHLVRDSVDIRILGRLATRAGGEVVADPF